MSFCCEKKYVLIIANAENEDKLRFLLEDVYEIEGKFDINVDEYESKDYKFMAYCGIERRNFDQKRFKVNCLTFKSKITAIICLENLNPRSLYLNDNLDELKRVFRADELHDLLYVFFTFTGESSSLNRLREEVLDFSVFKSIGLFYRSLFCYLGEPLCWTSNETLQEYSSLINQSVETVQPRGLTKKTKTEIKNELLKKTFISHRFWILEADTKTILNDIRFGTCCFCF
jgi:hypothetical protein